ncbi:unnamed protein product [Rhizoctonia solani]|uniref:Uncharacterized protein n=1 Tax=Rhizoctonia solani TaxID=456999 RepID=A0A8H3E231_9AGAM|nr:unnamed protein product [Rhizoctonia solani]
MSTLRTPHIYKNHCIYFTWASQASKYNALNPIEAYQAAVDLLPQFIWLGATNAQRYEDLKLVETLAVDAAHAAIVFSNYSLALEWLEHTRCIVWNQNLMLRSPLDQLLASYPVLATRLQTVANELHAASSNSRESHAFSRSITSEQAAQGHRRLAQEYGELLTQARLQPGFENFLQPMQLSGLICAARNGPIAVINCHEDDCDAILYHQLLGSSLGPIALIAAIEDYYQEQELRYLRQLDELVEKLIYDVGGARLEMPTNIIPTPTLLPRSTGPHKPTSDPEPVCESEFGYDFESDYDYDLDHNDDYSRAVLVRVTGVHPHALESAFTMRIGTRLKPALAPRMQAPLLSSAVLAKDYVNVHTVCLSSMTGQPSMDAPGGDVIVPVSALGSLTEMMRHRYFLLESLDTRNQAWDAACRGSGLGKRKRSSQDVSIPNKRPAFRTL